MSEVLKLFLSLSVSGSILALILFALKPLIKNRLSQTWQYYIWLIVILRFLLPFTPEFSVVGGAVWYFQNADSDPVEEVTPDYPVFTMEEDFLMPDVNNTSQPPQTLRDTGDKITATPVYRRDILNNIWLLWSGLSVILLVRKVTSYRGFIRYVKAGTHIVTDTDMLNVYKDACMEARIKKPLPLYVNDLIASPMLVGFVRPVIVIPYLEIAKSELQNVFRHELIHYRRLDIFYKWMVQITVCLHWFNPLVYVISREINRKCELSCDENILKNMDKESRLAYGDTLVTSLKAEGNYGDLVVSVSLSENAALLKERLSAIMNFRKKSKMASMFSAVLTTIMLCCATFTGAYAATANVVAAAGTATGSGTPYEKEVFNLTDRFDFAGGGFHHNTSFTLENDAAIQISTNITTTKGQLTFAVQPIRDGDYFRNNLLIDKNGNVVKKLYEASGTDVKETKTISLESGTYWVSLTGVANIQNADWKITGTITTDKLLDAAPSGRTNSLSQSFEKYKPFGVTYNAEQNAVFYNSKRVKLFVDFKAYKEDGMTYAFDLCYQDRNTNSTLYLEAVKDAGGKVIGIRGLNEEIARDLLDDMVSAYSSTGKADSPDLPGQYFTLDATTTLPKYGITATDKDLVELKGQTEVWDDQGQGVHFLQFHVMDTAFVYVYYNGGGRYPWNISVDGSTIYLNLYSNKTAMEGSTLVQITSPPEYKLIEVSLDGNLLSSEEIDTDTADTRKTKEAMSLDFEENNNVYVDFPQTFTARNWGGNAMKMKNGHWFGWDGVDVLDGNGLAYQAVVFAFHGSDSYKQKLNDALAKLYKAYPNNNAITGYMDSVSDKSSRRYGDGNFSTIKKTTVTDINGVQADAYIVAVSGSDDFIKAFDTFFDTVVDEYFKSEFK